MEFIGCMCLCLHHGGEVGWGALNRGVRFCDGDMRSAKEDIWEKGGLRGREPGLYSLDVNESVSVMGCGAGLADLERGWGGMSLGVWMRSCWRERGRSRGCCFFGVVR